MSKKQNSKDVMLPHSEAKVKFYKAYLERYLRILCNSQYINTINIYDVFCGMGVYKNGGLGSPIEAAKAIKDVCVSFPTKTQINLYVNDKNNGHVGSVKNYIESNIGLPENLNTTYSSIDGEVFLKELTHKLEHTSAATRNLVFIDPYGYKEIKKGIIQSLLINGKTEVMIFLPISFMNRFTQHALSHEEMVMYKPLCDFVKSFFPSNHLIINGEQITNLDFISYLTTAFSFNNLYYSTSYHIQRSTNNYFALFFITPNQCGYEKILETKWNLDEIDGNGFELPKPPSIFDMIYKEEGKKSNYERLKDKTLDFLSTGSKDNKQLYEFALRNEYLPKHMVELLSNLRREGIIVTSPVEGATVNPRAFYINRKDDVRIMVKLKGRQ